MILPSRQCKNMTVYLDYRYKNGCEAHTRAESNLRPPLDMRLALWIREQVSLQQSAMAYMVYDMQS